jgi:uncharacterized membrane protein
MSSIRTLLLLCAVLLSGSSVQAQTPAADAGEQDQEEIEEIEEVVDVQEAEELQQVDQVASNPAGGAGDMGLGTIVGRLHPALVHFPIAWMILALLLELGVLFFQREHLQTFALIVVALGVASFAPAALSGFLRADEFTQASEGLLAHRNIMLAAFAFAALAMGIGLATRKSRGKLGGKLRILSLAASVFLLSWGGHLGGKLVFGERFLPF